MILVVAFFLRLPTFTNCLPRSFKSGEDPEESLKVMGSYYSNRTFSILLEQPCSHYMYHLLLVVSIEQLYRLLGKCAFYGHLNLDNYFKMQAMQMLEGLIVFEIHIT